MKRKRRHLGCLWWLVGLVALVYVGILPAPTTWPGYLWQAGERLVTVAKTMTNRTPAAQSAAGQKEDQATTTPIEGIVEGQPLNKTYYYTYTDEVPKSVRALFKQAIATYNATGVVKLVPGSGRDEQNSITIGIYYKNMGLPVNGGTFELGVGGPRIIKRTGLFRSVVNHADVKLNLSYSGMLRPSVAIHELGHALGLDHSDRLSSVMYPIDRGQTTLSPADLAALRAIYPN